VDARFHIGDEEKNMHAFHIHYRNTQGTLMRILTAVSRRGLDMPYVQACADERGQRASLLLDVNTKQIGQLCRDWYAIVDVIEVKVGTPTAEMLDSAAGVLGAHPPASAGVIGKNASAAMA
jgi:acetolactate synthase small subunit